MPDCNPVRAGGRPRCDNHPTLSDPGCLSVVRLLVGRSSAGRCVGVHVGGWRHALRAGWRTCEPGLRSTQARAPHTQPASLCQSQSQSQPVTAAGRRTAAKGRAYRPIDRRRHHSHTCHDALLCTLRFFSFSFFFLFFWSCRTERRQTHARVPSLFIFNCFWRGCRAAIIGRKPKTVGFGMGRELVRVDG